eukprot:scaffold109087_cov55-Phaeocystis_antarctica.AAC.2
MSSLLGTTAAPLAGPRTSTRGGSSARRACSAAASYAPAHSNASAWCSSTAPLGPRRVKCTRALLPLTTLGLRALGAGGSSTLVRGRLVHSAVRSRCRLVRGGPTVGWRLVRRVACCAPRRVAVWHGGYVQRGASVHRLPRAGASVPNWAICNNRNSQEKGCYYSKDTNRSCYYSKDTRKKRGVMTHHAASPEVSDRHERLASTCVGHVVKGLHEFGVRQLRMFHRESLARHPMRRKERLELRIGVVRIEGVLRER